MAQNSYSVPFEGVFQGFENNVSYGYLDIEGGRRLFIHYKIFNKADISRSMQIKGLKVMVLKVDKDDRGRFSAGEVEFIDAPATNPETENKIFSFSLNVLTDISFIGKVQNVAYRCAEHGAKLSEKKKEYKNVIKSLPMMIRHNGLISTFAYLDCHEKEPYQRIYTHLAGRLIAIEPEMVKGSSIDFEMLPSVTVKKLTFEVMTFLGWLKLYSSGLISD